METNLRQADNNVNVIGKVSEISLEEGTNDKGQPVIKGNVTIKTSTDNFIRFSVYVGRFKTDDTLNSMYDGIATVKDEYKSIADFGEDEADVVSVRGTINPYVNKNTGENVTGYKANFFNRIKNTADVDFKAEYKIEMIVEKIFPEVDNNGEETGRVKIQGWSPSYAGIDPILLYVNEDMASDAEGYFEPGNTYEFWGDIEATRHREEKVISGGFGKSRKEVKVTFKNEMICTGGSDPYDEDDERRPAYKQDAIKLAIQQREDQIKANQSKKQPKKKTANLNGRSLNFGF